MNAGAYDGEMAQVIDWVDCLDETVAQRLGKDELKLGYRASIFSTALEHRGGTPHFGHGRRDRHSRKNGGPGPAPPVQTALGIPQRGSAFKRPVGHFPGG